MTRFRKQLMVVGPKTSYLSWLQTTRGLKDVRVIHVTEPGHVQGWRLKSEFGDDVVDLTDGDSSWAELVEYARTTLS